MSQRRAVSPIEKSDLSTLCRKAYLRNITGEERPEKAQPAAAKPRPVNTKDGGKTKKRR